MNSSSASPPAPQNHDIFFTCEHCSLPLVVDAAAAGMTVTCQRCLKPTVVPHVPLTGGLAAPSPIDDIQRKLKENESQRTEVTGYINQLCIQLHRWKLRLQTLNERKTDLEAELAGLK